MNVVYSWPTIVFGPVFTLLVVGLSFGGLALVRRYVPQEKLREHNDITGFMIAVVGVIYAVALAFLVIVVWEDFNHSEDTVNHEVDALSDIYHGVQVFPPSTRAQLRAVIRQYNGLMTSEEWPAMQHGKQSAAAEQAAHDIADEINALNPRTPREVNEHEELLSLDETFLDARRERLHQNDAGLPAIMWWTMAFCGAVTIGFAFLFGGVNRTQHYVMVGLLAAIIAALLVLIIEINLPFRGDVGVNDHIWHSQRAQFAELSH